ADAALVLVAGVHLARARAELEGEAALVLDEAVFVDARRSVDDLDLDVLEPMGRHRVHPEAGGLAGEGEEHERVARERELPKRRGPRAGLRIALALVARGAGGEGDQREEE